MDQTTDNHKQHMGFVNSLSFCKQFFNQLYIKTFEGVGLQNAKKMAPYNTFLQTVHVIHSFVTMAFTQKMVINQPLIEQSDFKPIQIDNLAVLQIDTQKAAQLPRMNTVADSISSTNSRLKSKKAGTQKSVRSRRFTQIQQQLPQGKSKQLSNFQKLPQIPNEYDFSQDPQLNKVRNNFMNIQKQKQSRQRQLNTLKQKNLVQKQRNQKIIKQMKRITYDYEGKLFGQGNGLQQPSKLLALNNKFSNLKKTLSNTNTNIESSPVIQVNKKKDPRSDRKQFKQPPLFREKAESIIQTIENNKGISAGVRIIEQLSDKKSMTKQNPLKKPDIHSLVDFKNTMKSSRFKQYHPVSLNKQKSSLNLSSLNHQQTTRTKHEGEVKQKSLFNKQFKSKSSYSLMDQRGGKSFQLLQDYQSSRDVSILGSINQTFAQKKVKYRGLPFIKTKGYKAIDIDSQKSFKLILDQKGQNSRQKVRTRILINDLQLLKTTLQDN